MSASERNKLFDRPHQDERAGDVPFEAGDSRDLDILEHVDIAFLMNYALDGQVEPETPGGFSLQGADNAEGQPAQAAVPDPQVIPSMNHDLQDEFLGLFDQEEQTGAAEEVAPPADANQVFGNTFDSMNDALEEEKESSIGPEVLGEYRNHHTIYKPSRLPSLFSDVVYVGLDIGAQNIKYVAVKKLGSKSKIIAFGIQANAYDHDADKGEVAEYVINSLNLKSRFPKALIAWSLHGPEVGFRRLSLPQMKKQMLSDAIVWSAKKEFDLEDVPGVIEYMKLPETDDSGTQKNNVLVAGCPERYVLETAQPFLNEHLIPYKTTPYAVALWRLYLDSSDTLKNKTIAFIDLAAKTSTISFVKDEVLEFSREIPTGGIDITDALTGTIFYHGNPYQLSRTDAEDLKLNYGFPEEGLEDKTEEGVPITEYAVLVRPILERLGNEIRRSIDYYKEHFKVQNLDSVMLHGGSSQLKNLVPFLEGFIDDEIEKLQMPKALSHSLTEQDWNVFVDRYSELVAPLSSAIDQDGKLNLLPRFLKGLRYLNVIRRGFIYTTLLVVLTMGLLSGSAYLRSRNSQSEFEMLQIKYKRLEPLKRRFDQLKQTQGGLLTKKRVYHKELALDNPLPMVLKAVSNLIPKGMSLRTMSLGQEPVASREKSGKKKGAAKEEVETGTRVLMSGVTRNPKPNAGIEIANFLLGLKKSGLFTDLKLVSQTYLEEEDELAFHIEGTLGTP